MLWFGLLLYLHLLAVVAAIAFAGYAHWGLDCLWRVTTTEVSVAVQRAARGAAGLIWAGAALLLTGAGLTQAAFPWTTAWIDFSMLGVCALAALAGLCSMRLGRLTPTRAARDPLLHAAGYLLPLLPLAILLIMVIKPGALASAFMLACAIAGGVTLSRHRGNVPSHTSISA